MRRGVTFLEAMMVTLVLAIVIALAARAASTAGLFFFTGQLNHAVQGAALVMAELEADLRRAARDPRTGVAVRAGEGGRSIAFYRVAPRQGRGLLVPVRWSLEPLRGSPDVRSLVRTTWDVEAGRWTRHTVPAVMVGTSREGGAEPTIDLTEYDCPMITVDLTVVARDRRVAGVAGSGNDSVSARVTVGLPHAPRFAARFLRPVKTLDELPAKES